jgi:hypothetical protein
MAEEVYPIKFDDTKGRAYINLTGDISPTRIRNTFFVISLNKSWGKGQRSILWHFKDAYFSNSFEFSGIFKNAHMVQDFAKPGKSAAVIEKDCQIEKDVSDFYSDIAKIFTERKIRHFKTIEEAEVWLDS